MRNISNKIFRANETHILCSVTFFFPEIVPFRDIFEKYSAAREGADNMATARGKLDKQAYTRASTRPRTHTHFHTRIFRVTAGQ